MNKSKGQKIFLSVSFYIMISVVFVYLFFPFAWALISSLKTDSQLVADPATFIPVDTVTGKLKVTFDNYISVFQNKVFLTGIKNSIILTLTTTALSLTIGSFAAFALGKLRFKGKTIILYLVLSVSMFPAISILTGLYLEIRLFPLSTLGSLILTYQLFALPFTVWVLTSFFRSIPLSLLQSAQVDGANFFQIFYLILLPLVTPALVTTGLLNFIGTWNEYLFALTLTITDPGARTIPVAIALFTGQVEHQEPFGAIMAASIVVTVPLLVLVIIAQKKIIGGLTSGAVKG